MGLVFRSETSLGAQAGEEDVVESITFGQKQSDFWQQVPKRNSEMFC